jgi:glycosyltransferase involved in cell wall biosynthesis
VDPTYSIAICNLNQAATLRESLTSILRQITREYEVVVVDDGSTDGSLDILEELSRTHDDLRYAVGDNDNIAEARNHSFREARGEYILTSLDTDDRYREGICDFVTVYREMEAALDRRFHLQGQGIAIAPRELFLEVPYRSMTYGEDYDRYRRLLAREAIVWFEHELFWEKIDSEGSLTRRRKSFQRTISEFRSGVTFRSTVEYHIEREPAPVALRACLSAAVAYLIAAGRGRYELPEPYHDKGKLFREVEERLATLPELEARYGFEIDRKDLSPRGREIFFRYRQSRPKT